MSLLDAATLGRGSEIVEKANRIGKDAERLDNVVGSGPIWKGKLAKAEQ